MPQQVRLWRVEQGETLHEVRSRPLDLESRLEVWLERDISLLSDDLLVIGRQVPTDYSGFIDLLCLNRDGDVVVVELKRDKTPRDVTAQALDYGSWVKDLSHDAVTAIADAYLGRERRSNLATEFANRFGEPLPDVLNGDHELLIVASSIDPSSERIIRYLSDTYGLRINAVTFQYFEQGPTELVARVFLIEPDAVQQRSSQRPTSKRRPAPSFEEFEEVARRNGVGALYRVLLDGLRLHLRPENMVTLVAFYGSLDGGVRAICSLYPEQSSEARGLHFTVYAWRLARFVGKPVDAVEQALPDGIEPWKYVSTSTQDESGYAGHFRTEADARAFLHVFQRGLGDEG